jgi:hypothetical protein
MLLGVLYLGLCDKGFDFISWLDIAYITYMYISPLVSVPVLPASSNSGSCRTYCYLVSCRQTKTLVV